MNKKSIISIILLIIVLVLFVGVIIKSNKEVELNDTFKLKIHESVSIKNENLKITLVSVSDSRCPEGVQCIWQGEINYKVKVNKKAIEFGTELTKEKKIGDYKFIIDDDNNSTRFLKMKVVKE